MKINLTEKQSKEVFEEINYLDKLLTERISAFHELPEYIQARHAYIFYRSRLYEIREMLTKSTKN